MRIEIELVKPVIRPKIDSKTFLSITFTSFYIFDYQHLNLGMRKIAERDQKSILGISLLKTSAKSNYNQKYGKYLNGMNLEKMVENNLYLHYFSWIFTWTLVIANLKAAISTTDILISQISYMSLENIEKIHVYSAKKSNIDQNTDTRIQVFLRPDPTFTCKSAAEKNPPHNFT